MKLPLPSYNPLPDSVVQRPRQPPGVWGNANFVSTEEKDCFAFTAEDDDTYSSHNGGDKHEGLSSVQARLLSASTSANSSASNMLSLDSATDSARQMADDVPDEPPNSEREFFFQWHVDAKKLESNDRQIISPSFAISEGVSVKLMIKPSCRSFNRSKGVGSVEVKFVGESTPAPKIRFSISVGHQAACAPLEHDFGKSLVCTSAKQLQDWNFSSSISRASQSLLVSLHVFEILHSDTL